MLSTITGFAGFRNKEINEVQIKTILGGAVAIECDVLDAVPAPLIEWFADDQLLASGPSVFSPLLYVDGGRYLYIQSLTEQQRNVQYHCEVANQLGYLRAIAPTTYTLDGDINMHTVTVYKPLETLLITLGDTEQKVMYYVAAVPQADGINPSVLSVVCGHDTNVTVLSNRLVIIFRSHFTKSVESYTITCVLVGSPITPSPEVYFSFTVQGKGSFFC